MKRFTLKITDGIVASIGVRLYETHDKMTAAIKRDCGHENIDGVAFTLDDTIAKTITVYFSREALTLDFVSHEFCHAAMIICARKFGEKNLLKRQEECATLHGEAVRLFWNKAMSLPADVCVLANEKLFSKDFHTDGRIQDFDPTKRGKQ